MALRKGHIVVIDDTLRFSSCVVTGVAMGFSIHPVSDVARGMRLAESLGAHFAAREKKGRLSLSPLSFIERRGAENKRVVLYSPNGAACSELVGEDDTAFVACLLNAEAAGRHVAALARQTGRDVTVIAAGEQQALATGERIMYAKEACRPVFAVEDYLGCGALLSAMGLPESGEALACRHAFIACREHTERILLDSFSGRYLVRHRRREDVIHASRLNHYDVVPRFKGGWIEGI